MSECVNECGWVAPGAAVGVDGYACAWVWPGAAHTRLHFSPSAQAPASPCGG